MQVNAMSFVSRISGALSIYQYLGLSLGINPMRVCDRGRLYTSEKRLYPVDIYLSIYLYFYVCVILHCAFACSTVYSPQRNSLRGLTKLIQQSARLGPDVVCSSVSFYPQCPTCYTQTTHRHNLKCVNTLKRT